MKTRATYSKPLQLEKVQEVPMDEQANQELADTT
jgi:hypothetical protein